MSRAQREAFEAGDDWRLMVSMLPPDDYTKENTDVHAEAFRRFPDSPACTVKQIVEQYCADEGYHGLYNIEKGCECRIGPSLEGTPPWACAECVKGDCRPGVLVEGKIRERT